MYKLLIGLVVLLMVGCGGSDPLEDTQAGPTPDTPLRTPTVLATATPPVQATAAPPTAQATKAPPTARPLATPTTPASPPELHRGTRWGEVIPFLPEKQRECIQDNLRDEYETVWDSPIIVGGDAPLAWEVEIWECIGTEGSRSIFVPVMIDMFEEQAYLTDDEKSCIRDVMNGVDIPKMHRLVYAGDQHNSEVAKMRRGFDGCQREDEPEPEPSVAPTRGVTESLPTGTRVPTATATPESGDVRTKSLAEHVVANIRAALEEADSVEDLLQTGRDGSQTLIGYLCDVVAGEYEPQLTLEDLTDNFALRTGIRGYCANR